ncbi:MAG: T9SS type A sorting domain-containing protein, partial [candidate division Zixibacteria bacterium]|nr:T9SS type A sorting domain-containing protein [candidate division Zixibacteria bacterium]
FNNNNATQYGGGIYCASSSPDISNCYFTDNTTNEFGGAILLSSSTPSLTNCYFSGNFAEELGGAICLQSSSPEIIETDFYSNSTDNIGGAIYCEESSPIFTESIFAGNSAINLGGAIGLEYNSSPQLTNCTLVKNGASNGGAIYCNFSPISIENSIISFGLSGGAIYLPNNNDLPTITCSNIFGNVGGDWIGNIADQNGIDGNFSIDPLFCEPEIDNYQLAGNSPCLSGNNECVLLIGALDMGCDIITDIEDSDGNSLPKTYQLSQNYPNPFNPATTINYSLPVKSFVTITVYNVLGREIKTIVNKSVDAGHHTTIWDGKAEDGNEVSSGIYLYRLSANDFISNRKMLLLK